MVFLGLYILSILLVIWGTLGEPPGEGVLPIIFSFLPGLGFLLGVVATVQIVKNLLQSGGKCLFGHKFSLTRGTEHTKNRARQELIAIMPLIKEANALRNARLDNVNISANPMWLVDRAAGINLKSLFKRTITE